MVEISDDMIDDYSVLIAYNNKTVKYPKFYMGYIDRVGDFFFFFFFDFFLNKKQKTKQKKKKKHRFISFM